jgi:hypothetical protein
MTKRALPSDHWSNDLTCAGCGTASARHGSIFCYACGEQERREIARFAHETERLMDGYPEDYCLECGKDIGDLEIGETLCRKCADG